LVTVHLIGVDGHVWVIASQFLVDFRRGPLFGKAFLKPGPVLEGLLSEAETQDYDFVLSSSRCVLERVFGSGST
jgi:hypothetical protein